MKISGRMRINPELRGFERRQIGTGAPRIVGLERRGEVKAVEEPGTFRLWAPASTPSIDKDDEIMLPSSFARFLPDYLKKNPAFLWGHRWFGSYKDIMGYVFDGKVTDQALMLGFDYDADIDPEIHIIWKKVLKGSIRGFSVGFLMEKWVTRSSPREYLEALPKFARQALESGRCRLVHTEVRLIECSQVGVPSNDDTNVEEHARQELAGSTRSITIPIERKCSDMDPVAKALESVAHVQSQMKALGDNQEAIVGALSSVAEGQKALADAIKGMKEEKPAAKAAEEKIRLEDLAEEDLSALVKTVTEAVRKNLGGANHGA